MANGDFAEILTSGIYERVATSMPCLSIEVAEDDCLGGESHQIIKNFLKFSDTQSGRKVHADNIDIVNSPDPIEAVKWLMD